MRKRLLLIAPVVVVLLAIAVAAFLLFGPGGDGQAERVVKAADQANAAIVDREFDVLHQMLSAEIQDTTTPANVQANFEEAEGALGSIVSVGRVSDPVIEGETAVVETEVTYEKDGQTTIKAFYDLYVLEGDEWRLAYSQPMEEVEPAATAGE